jgi:DNA-binding transcriptional MerR regulator
MSSAAEPRRSTPARRGVKSAAAFRTISEVARELDVPQHVLRFWETKFAQVRPLKRGGGRRYYRPGDVDLLRRIRDLLYTEGYTIKGVQKLLREGGAKAVTEKGAKRGEPKEVASGPRSTGDDEAGGARLTGPVRGQIESVLEELVQLRAVLREIRD